MNASLWWLYALRSLLALSAGIMAIANPSQLLGNFAIYIGIYLIMGFFLNLAGAIRQHAGRDWAWEIPIGVVLMLTGGTLLHHPLMPTPHQIWLYAVAVLTLSGHAMAAGYCGRNPLSVSRWLLMAGASSGLLSLLAAILAPRLDDVLAVTIGVQLISYGLCFSAIALAFRVGRTDE